ncbi:MAG: hypothetical protein LBP87_10375 [Planctomycetaceae bacterium]|jgi:hypothetical protein|nr:hypothetical protein [Planctomycetaceae bacterium]
MAKDKTVKDKTYTFTVLEGEHQGVKKTYKKGETFQSQYPLDQMFVGKFLRGAEVIAVDIKKAPDTRMIFVFADADDVTHLFPVAAEHELRVFVDAMGGFAVAAAQNEGDDDLMNLAPTVMGSKQQVNKWLAEYIKRQEKE